MTSAATAPSLLDRFCRVQDLASGAAIPATVAELQAELAKLRK